MSELFPKGKCPDTQLNSKTNSPFLLELFCGSAGVSAQFCALGGEALGIDHHLNHHRLKSAAIKLDLTESWVQEMVLQEIASGRVKAVHMGPPCGTSSRARNIPIKRKIRRAGAPRPKPLRSDVYPDGFPWLTGLAKTKVSKANFLYLFCSKVVDQCEKYKVLFTIENPERSFFWATTFMQRHVACHHLWVIDACEYGSEYRKGTAFLANFTPSRLNKRCSGNHTHKTWKIEQDSEGNWKFDTSAEAEYPRELAKSIAVSFMEELDFQTEQASEFLAYKDAEKIHAGNQPRKVRTAFLLADFKHKVSIQFPSHLEPPKVISTDVLPPWQGVPLGSKLLDVQTVPSENGDIGSLNVATFGVYHTPEEFIEKASGLVHPLDVPLPSDDPNLGAIAFILSHSPPSVASFRANMLKYYVSRAKDLETEEKDLHARLDPQLEPVLASKRLLLFKEMLDDAGIEDTKLFDDVCNGFRLIGDIEPSGQFSRQWRPAIVGREQLRQTALWSQKAVLSSCRMVGDDPEIAEAVWAETLEQASSDKRWVVGPFSAEQISGRLGHDWIPARRFGVRQNGKIRSVDDYSQFLINAATSVHEKIDLEGIDSICSVARFFLGADSQDGFFELPTSNETLGGAVHKGWERFGHHNLFGRCLDLKHAYKQLARHPDDSWVSVIAVWDPSSRETKFFEAVALPFGAVSSVIAFNRTARALRTILSKLFCLVATNFFDDFCQLELDPLQSSAWATAEGVLRLLGWRISEGEDKRRPFSKSFEILGAVVTFPEDGRNLVEVSNKKSRLEQLEQMVSVLKSKQGSRLPRSFLESFKGRMLYAAGHTYGRCTHLACQLLHKLGSSDNGVQVSIELVQASLFALDLLKNSGPRVITPWRWDNPVLVFTDGAAEEEFQKVTHGALLVDTRDGTRAHFGDVVPDDFVKLWKRNGKKQVISQAELFPVLVAKATWGQMLDDRSVLWFVDNESIRIALVRNFSPVLDNFCLLQFNSKVDLKIGSRNWYSRVPSHSNPSDAASRLCFDSYERSRLTTPVYGPLLDHLTDFRSLIASLEGGG